MAALISVDEARALISRAIAPLGAEEISLEMAAGRVLARGVVAAIDQPPFDAAAMDGYAVRFKDAAAPGALRVIGVSAAGARFSGAVAPGGAVRLFTGAPMPEGANHVIIQEETQREGDFVTISTSPSRAANVRPAGVDFRRGDTLGRAGERLSPRALALIAAGDVAHVAAARRPRVGVLANGDELRPPGRGLGPDDIVSSIPYGLRPMIEAWGGEAVDLGTARDDPDDISSRIGTARDLDIIVPVGGASVGDRDYMRAAFHARGFTPIFEKVAIKPGKPTWFGRLEGGPFVLGLPGNPASALVTARIFLKTAIDCCLGGGGEDHVGLRLGAPLAANGPRETYLRAKRRAGAGGEGLVEAFADQDSSLLGILAASDALIRRRAGAPAAAAGEPVRCLLW